MEILDLIGKLTQFKKSIKSLYEWLAEATIKRWSTKMSWRCLIQLNADEGTLRLREISEFKVSLIDRSSLRTVKLRL